MRTATLAAICLLIAACSNKQPRSTANGKHTSAADTTRLANPHPHKDDTQTTRTIRKIVPIAFDFTNICSVGGINIEYTQAEHCSIELEGDSALLPHVTVNIESRQLTLGLQTDGNKDINLYGSNYDITAHITAPTLQYASLCASGNFTSKGKWINPNIHIGSLSTGSFYIEDLECETFKFEGTDYDHSTFKQIKANTATIICFRKSHAEFNIDVNDLLVIAENESRLRLNGTAKKKHIETRGQATVEDNL